MARTSKKVTLKRVYEAASKTDATRVLVDRLWPRGVSKQKASIHVWMKEIAPSTELRKWFGHDPERWQEFRAFYRKELRGNKTTVAEMRALMKAGKVTLVFGAADPQHNHALVLAEFLAGD
ncbi:MAG: hypothetical protein JWR80_1951 [Bradyrhizobium sp.]|nr:hypothetical protein [Bradyrhizobium sp.]